MRALVFFIALVGCTGTTSTLYAQSEARTNDIAATAISQDSIAALSTLVIDAPTDSIDREANELVRYAILNAELKAAAYRSEGMPWFHAGHTLEKYFPLLDPSLIPLQEYSFGTHRNPVLTAQAALAFYNAYLDGGADDHLLGFLNNVDWLLLNHDEHYLRYDFDWRHGGRLLPDGWVSAMAQGEALAAVSTAYFLTGEEKYLRAAEGFFKTMYSNQAETWTFHVDDRGYYWLEEYPNQDLCHVLNGMLFGLWGLWDFYVVTGDPFALALFEAGVRSVIDHYEDWNISGKDLSHYCLHNLTYDTYHDIHVQQLDAYFKRFDIPALHDAAVAFRKNYHVTIAPAEIEFGATFVLDRDTLSLHVTTTGDDEVMVDSVASNAVPFAASFPSARSVADDGLTVPVIFAPIREGEYAGVVRVYFDGSHRDVPVRGRALSPVHFATPSGMLDFGTVSVGVGDTLVVVLGNEGNHPVAVFDGDVATPAFHVVRGWGIVPPHGAMDVYVVFDPPENGIFADTLRVRTRAATDALTLPLLGEAITETGTDVDAGTPAAFRLEQNFPNPFDGTTVIRYDVPRRSRVRLEVYNTLGQVVAVPLDVVRIPGTHEEVVRLSSLPSGVYYYRMRIEGMTRTRRMVLIGR